MNEPKDILVLCRKSERYEPWVRVLLEAGAESVYVKTGEGRGREVTSSSNLSGVPEAWSKVPDEFLAALVHAGDSDLWSEEKEVRQVFWFNASGEPSAEGDARPIKRRTSAADFEVTVSDAEEILAYSAGERNEVPSCCESREIVETLPALSILCQGYLAVHAERHGEEDSTESALDQMGWSEGLISNCVGGRFEEVTKPDWWRLFDDEDSLLAEARGEWGDETDGWSKVEELINRVTGDRDEEDQDRGDTDDTEPKPLESEEDRKLVADAYCKLVERLGGEPCP